METVTVSYKGQEFELAGEVDNDPNYGKTFELDCVLPSDEVSQRWADWVYENDLSDLEALANEKLVDVIAERRANRMPPFHEIWLGVSV